MAIINFARREIEAKIVFYGPALSGKTTNVQVSHGSLPDTKRGELHMITTEDERTLFFDYAPITRGQIAGFTARFKLFSVPGQVFYKETRRIVLQGADAVVFVADSAPDRAQANIDSLLDLEENLRSHGIELATLPLVIQLNKRDLPNARSVQAMGSDLNTFGVPLVEAVALSGAGVIETLETVTDLAAARIRDSLAGRKTTLSLTAIDQRDAENDEEVVRRHLKKIEQVRPQEEARGREMVERGEVDPNEVDAFLLQNVERAGEYLAEHEESSDDPLSVPVSQPVDSPNDPSSSSHTPRISNLPPGPVVELGFLPPALRGYRATRILGTAVTPSGGVKMDLMMEATESGGVSRCTVNLKPTEPLAEHPRPARPAAPPPVAPPMTPREQMLIPVAIGLGGTLLGLVLALLLT